MAGSRRRGHVPYLCHVHRTASPVELQFSWYRCWQATHADVAGQGKSPHLQTQGSGTAVSNHVSTVILSLLIKMLHYAITKGSAGTHVCGQNGCVCKKLWRQLWRHTTQARTSTAAHRMPPGRILVHICTSKQAVQQ